MTEQQAVGTFCCRVCRTPIDTSQWFPASKERGDDGELSLHYFCSETCQSAFGADR